MDDEYQKFLQLSAGGFDAARDYAQFLEDTGQPDRAISVLEEWLQSGHVTTFFETVEARTALARIHQKEGRLEEALESMGDSAETFQGGAMHRQARILADLGRMDEAQDLAFKALQRYPFSAMSVSVVAEILWRQGKMDQATDVIQSHAHALSVEGWRFGGLASAFVSAFKEDPQGGVEATDSLLQGGILPAMIGQLAMEVNKAGAPQAAFELQSRLHTNTLQNLELMTRAYTYLAKAEGQDTALSWIRAQVPPDQLNPLSMFAFPEGAFELLWDVVPPEPTGYGADYVWLIRSASLTRSPDPRHKAAILNYLKTAPPGHNTQIARYMLGQIPEEALYHVAENARIACEVAFFLGYKAESEGDFHAASQWYGTAVMLNQWLAGEFRWAFNRLYVWQSQRKSLDRRKVVG